MRRAPRVAAAGMLATASTVAVVALLSGPARAQAPDVAAWWNAANVGNGAPAPPAPPDVPDGDLLVQGSNALQAVPTTPLTNAPASSQAVAGLTFELPADATVGALTLDIDGSPPSGVSIVACRATQSFAAEDNGAWSDVPPADCSHTVPATLKGSQLVFDDVTPLVANAQLSIVLLPGALDRVVIKAPGDNALSVTTLSAGSVGSSAPAFGSGTNAGPSATAAGAQPVAPVGGAAVLPPASAASPDAAPPVVAPSPAGAEPGAANVAASSATPGSGGLSTTQRRVLAGAVIAAELLGFLLLMGDRGVERMALGATGPAVAGGRLRPPDRVARAVEDNRTWAGVGRFRAERTGPPPRL